MAEFTTQHNAQRSSGIRVNAMQFVNGKTLNYKVPRLFLLTTLVRIHTDSSVLALGVRWHGRFRIMIRAVPLTMSMDFVWGLNFFLTVFGVSRGEEGGEPN